VGESARGLTEVSSNIQGVNTAAGETMSGIEAVKMSTDDLVGLAGALDLIMMKFKI
jgi:methyl-accepting chemotaxis protein